MNSELLGRIAALTGERPLGSVPLAGGAIGRVDRVRLARGDTLVAKRSPGVPLTVEAAMLDRLAALEVLPVPRVLYRSDDLLLLEDLPGDSDHSDAACGHLGTLLAELHDRPAPSFGFPFATLLGPYPLDNRPSDDWPHYYRTRRFEPMRVLADASGHLPAALSASLERVGRRLAVVLDHDPEPAPIHGDLWATNVLSLEGRVSGVVDPALSWSDPEVELAYADLFGGFSAALFDRYQALRPIARGFWEVRRHLYRLPPLMVHVAHFGARYLPALRRSLDEVETQL